ncbi:c-type cytochrome [Pseudoduganella plicata]|uniref:C-type cytochrome n=1 Tax=Pseudoduganella plicata TaxID=321984 RepID=A0A4P7BJE6_9BURK|nr:c-type cytochrome [Pseudoduganella plicata]QBQ39031.1 c-type cytochrome [Pseudoduganella plicata]GGY86650.1 cytochrome c [Pseudoduganella plicata]
MTESTHPLLPSLRHAAVLALLALLLPRIATAAPAVPDTLEQRLAPCLACHQAKDRNDAFFPRIAGKPEGYLYNQLRNFQDGRRQYPLMTYMVSQLPEPYLREIAGWFAAQHPPHIGQPAGDATPAQLERGRVLVLQGDAGRKVPACVACHGRALTGVAPAIPGLVGLPRDYINAQFGAWRNKVRKAQAPDCMAQVASRLSADDIAAVSAWLSSQRVDDDARPATTLPAALPLACGGVPAHGGQP